MPHKPRIIGWRCELWYLSEVSNWCITTTSRLGQLCVFSKSNRANSKRHKKENDEYNDHEDGLKENIEWKWERVHHRDRSICICLRPRAWATLVLVWDLRSSTARNLGIRGRFRQHRAPRRYPQVSRPQSGDMPPEHFLRKDILEYLYPDTTNTEKCTVWHQDVKWFQ